MALLSRRTLLTIALPAMTASMARAEDAEDYPDRPVTIVSGFPPGGIVS